MVPSPGIESHNPRGRREMISVQPRLLMIEKIVHGHTLNATMSPGFSLTDGRRMLRHALNAT